MRAIALLLVSCLVGSSGCIIKGKGKNVSYALNGAAIVGGAALAATAHADMNRDPENGAEALGKAIAIPGLAIMMMVGIATAAGGVVGLAGTAAVNAGDKRDVPGAAVATRCPVEAPSEVRVGPGGARAPNDPPSTVPAELSFVVRLTMQARMAAGGGHCSAVKWMSAKVADADPEYHAAVFVCDSLIARCL